MRTSTCLLTATVLMFSSAAASAQGKPTPPAKPTPARTSAAAQSPPERIGVRGFVTFGSFSAQAQESFDTIFGTQSGFVFGGGAQVLLPRGFYVEGSASRFHQSGERAFVGPNGDVFRLGIPLDMTLTPLEITGGWRYRHCPRPARTRAAVCRPRVIPYAGGGFSSYRYEETSEFAEADDDVDDRFNGFHLVGGAEYVALPWLAIGGELAWSSVPDALGEGGVSAAFDEDNLGGTTFRVKISVGR